MIQHDGFYYYCESKNHQRSIRIRKSRTIAGIGQDPGLCVWKAPATGRNSQHVWAPELHLFGGKWFIYYAADDGRNETHRMWVLESEGDNPLGPYHCRGELKTDGWAIDGTVLTADDGRMYFIWSGWPGEQDGQQNLYISHMKTPVALTGHRTLICTPDQPWERKTMAICEGPQVLQRDGKIFIIYSASASWTEHYCLGLLENSTGDLLDPQAWQKHGLAFESTEDVWGVGHCSFVKSLCGTEDWILYHAKSEKKHGWEDRDVHAKRFTWTNEGLPDFGKPTPREKPAQPAVTAYTETVGTSLESIAA
jgi:GH43 family beta-xylosidase